MNNAWSMNDKMIVLLFFNEIVDSVYENVGELFFQVPLIRMTLNINRAIINNEKTN